MSMSELNYNGSCICGEVEIHVEGAPLFNGFCHCHNCTNAMGTSPVHMLGVPTAGFSVTKGQDKVKEWSGYHGSLRNGRATCCGSSLYQYPEGKGFHAVFPRMLTGYVKGKSSKLPADLMPTGHMNYENRTLDSHDDLPKFQDMPLEFGGGGVMCDNAGNDLVQAK
jgi:hypothetical protein